MKKLLIIPTIGLLLLAGCASKIITTNSEGSSTTNYIPNTVATTVTGIATSVVPFVPQPWGGLAGAILALVTAGASGIAAYKNKQMAQHSTMLSAVIAGVEQAGTPDTKKAIQTIAQTAGVQDKLDEIVQGVTSLLPSK